MRSSAALIPKATISILPKAASTVKRPNARRPAPPPARSRHSPIQAGKVWLIYDTGFPRGAVDCRAGRGRLRANDGCVLSRLHAERRDLRLFLRPGMEFWRLAIAADEHRLAPHRPAGAGRGEHVLPDHGLVLARLRAAGADGGAAFRRRGAAHPAARAGAAGLHAAGHALA